MVILQNRIIQELLKISVFYKTRGIMCNHMGHLLDLITNNIDPNNWRPNPLIFILILPSSLPASLRLSFLIRFSEKTFNNISTVVGEMYWTVNMSQKHLIPPEIIILALRRRNVLFTVHHSIQYSEINVMHFLFSLLRIKGLYIFRALLAHPQEMLNKRHLVYCVRVMSIGCYQDWSGSSQLT
jgi:hypothetical protein